MSGKDELESQKPEPTADDSVSLMKRLEEQSAQTPERGFASRATRLRGQEEYRKHTHPHRKPSR
ncbi:MAG: hypothetical protein AABY33_06315 [Pseudomonadota bacterium]